MRHKTACKIPERHARDLGWILLDGSTHDSAGFFDHTLEAADLIEYALFPEKLIGRRWQPVEIGADFVSGFGTGLLEIIARRPVFDEISKKERLTRRKK